MAKVMFSGRFDGAEKEAYLRHTAAALAGLGFEILVVEADAGEQFGPQTMEYLDDCDIVVAMVCDKYGERTDSPYCTYAEVKYFIDKRKRVIPVQLYSGEWPPQPDKAGASQNKFFFTGDRVKVMAVGREGKLKSPEELAACISTILMKMPAKEPVTAKKKEEEPVTAKKEDEAKEQAERKAKDAAGTASTSGASAGGGTTALAAKSVSELRRLAEQRGVSLDGCLEKAELVERLQEPVTAKKKEEPVTAKKEEKEAELKLLDARGWYNLGLYHRGGRVGGKHFTEKQCYENALAIDPQMAMAWKNLGVVGGGAVGGKVYNTKECYQQALTLNPSFPELWNDLAKNGGGIVDGKVYNKDECMAKYNRLKA